MSNNICHTCNSPLDALNSCDIARLKMSENVSILMECTLKLNVTVCPSQLPQFRVLQVWINSSTYTWLIFLSSTRKHITFLPLPSHAPSFSKPSTVEPGYIMDTTVIMTLCSLCLLQLNRGILKTQLQLHRPLFICSKCIRKRKVHSISIIAFT